MYKDYISYVNFNGIQNTLRGLFSLWVGKLKADQDYICRPRILDDFFMIYVKEGKGTYRTCGKDYSLNKNDLFFLFPGTVHTYFTDKENLLELFWIGYNGIYVKEFLKNINISPENPIIKKIYNTKILYLINEIIENKKNNSYAAELKASGNLSNIFGELMENCSETIIDYNINPLKYTRIVEKAMAFMDMNYPNDISINIIATHCGLSRSYFSTRFKKETGISPLEYLANIRLIQSKNYLNNSNLSINEIAHSVGFNDPLYFSKFFKKHTNMPPINFRNKNRNQITNQNSTSLISKKAF